MTSHKFLTSRFPASRRVRTFLVAVVAAAALMLAGCNSGGTPSGPDTTSPSATESATPSPTPTPTPATETSRALNLIAPKLPEDASSNTKDGLQSFSRYYVELLEYAYSTGEVSKLEGISSPTCSTCSGPIGDIENAYSDGGWVVGGDLEATAVTTSFLPSSTGSFFVNLSIKQGRTAYYSGPGILRKDIPAPTEDAPMQLTAKFLSGAWQVEDFSPPKGLQ
ncbi:hypothetical protein QFZ30_003258 [Arthrobacter pascens]|uniref:DUF6318 family protein n=1 Tax=Arthrobacter pascens TaxID=1677 RepID=UPI0027907170|nr:hypothetical protein [Arthrobacter pascens]